MLKKILLALAKVVPVFIKETEKTVDVKKAHTDKLSIEAHLQRRLELFECDYIGGYRFHNGTKFIGGGHKINFSRLYEARKEGHINKKGFVQDYSIVNFEDMFNRIMASELVYYPNTDSYDGDPYKKEEIFQLGVKSVAFVLMKDQDAYPIGFITFEYHRETNFTEKEKKAVISFGRFISDKICKQ